MFKCRRIFLVNVFKKLGVMFSGKKDCVEFDKWWMLMDVNLLFKFMWISVYVKMCVRYEYEYVKFKEEVCKRNEK